MSRRSEVIREATSGLAYPKLFVLLALVFIVDLLIPDAIPFADEILLGLATAILGLWRRKKKELPDESERFVGIDMDVKDILNKGFNTKLAKEFCNEPGMFPKLHFELSEYSSCV